MILHTFKSSSEYKFTLEHQNLNLSDGKYERIFLMFGSFIAATYSTEKKELSKNLNHLIYENLSDENKIFYFNFNLNTLIEAIIVSQLEERGARTITLPSAFSYTELVEMGLEFVSATHGDTHIYVLQIGDNKLNYSYMRV